MAEGYRLRRGRVSIPNQIYSITTVTKNRVPIFQDFYRARKAVRIIKRQHDSAYFDCLCFVVMPDHLHLLIQLKETITLEKSVQQTKALISQHLGMPIWQKGFYDRAIRKDEDIKAIARYIVANPLRAGLVGSVRKYPHWDCIWL